ncbi:MAG: alpha-amylase [Chitinophagaceae bacterium]|nr:MAG: alpha-amylase [Chitinophagaceae bacterium]
MKKGFLLLALFFLPSAGIAQSYSTSGMKEDTAIFDHINPPNWWTGMKDHFLQILFHGKSIGSAQVTLSYPGVQLLKVHRVENKNYLFVDLNISSSARPGKIPIHFDFDGKKPFVYQYSLERKSPDDGITRAMGVSPEDFIYLLMPDRFSDGDTTNDRVPGMLDQSLNRDSMYDRHGGDIQGIMNHLNYFNQLGVTALWLNPVIENDEPHASYHGYAFTDNYKVDPRVGTNTLYARFVKDAHTHHLKVVQDIVLNHAGDRHWILKDMPMKDWLNEWPSYTQTSYRESPLFDPYAAASDKKKMSDGWFVPSMPDLNQRNPFVANYLTENAIWWVEYAGIDAYRVDTYIYCDLGFLNRFNAALLREFPHLFIFGETWVHGVTAQAYFARNRFNIPFKSNLPGAEDFQLNFAVKNAFTQPPGWTEGINQLYLTLAKDFVYQDPMDNVIFLDNHDMTRFLSTVNNNVASFKSGFAWLLTTRGIPQMYYGDEILMDGIDNPDGKVRQDFPGGWPGDKQDKFLASGRTPAENDMYNYVSRLAHYRMHSTALQNGSLMQYVPENNIYVYFRYDTKSTIMVIMNANDQEKTLTTDRFTERMKGFTSAKNVVTGKSLPDIKQIELKPDQTLVLELEH